MSHTTRDKNKLILRVRRIRGQVEALERALDSDQECAEVLQLLTGARGAMNSLMAELFEGHIRFHLLGRRPSAEQQDAAGELVDVVRAYLK